VGVFEEQIVLVLRWANLVNLFQVDENEVLKRYIWDLKGSAEAQGKGRIVDVAGHWMNR
jgi:hypothetical protein